MAMKLIPVVATVAFCVVALLTPGAWALVPAVMAGLWGAVALLELDDDDDD
jgi:hypothetical protein